MVSGTEMPRADIALWSEESKHNNFGYPFIVHWPHKCRNPRKRRNTRIVPQQIRATDEPTLVRCFVAWKRRARSPRRSTICSQLEANALTEKVTDTIDPRNADEVETYKEARVQVPAS